MEYTTLGYSFITDEDRDMSKVPERALNGGLYVGGTFQKDAPWANVPIKPEAHILMRPNEASWHIPGYTRPGNNQQEFPEHKMYDVKNFPKLMCYSNDAVAAAGSK